MTAGLNELHDELLQISCLRGSLLTTKFQLEEPFISAFCFIFEITVELVTVTTLVHPTVTIRTEGNNVFWVIRAAIAPARKMMDLEERLTVGGHKRRVFLAALADAVSHSERKLSNDFGP